MLAASEYTTSLSSVTVRRYALATLVVDIPISLVKTVVDACVNVPANAFDTVQSGTSAGFVPAAAIVAFVIPANRSVRL